MGILVGLLTAGAAASLNVFLKKLPDFSPNFRTWIRVVGAAPSLALLVFLFSEWTIPSLEFWFLIIVIKTPIEILLAYVGTKALDISPLSIIGPLAAFTSIFLIPVGFVVLGELPTPVGFVGVLLIFIGSFFLGWQKEGDFAFGIRAMPRDRGVLLAIFAAFLASIAIAVTKLSFDYAPPLLAAFYSVAIMVVALSPTIWGQTQRHLRGRLKPLSGLWLTSSASVALHNVGLALIPAVYFISIKRLSIVFDVFFGRAFFAEGRIRERLAGATLMVAGVILIAAG